MIPLDDGQIDETDPRIKRIICLICKRMIWVERGSRLDHEGMCQGCSVRSDIIAAGLGLQ